MKVERDYLGKIYTFTAESKEDEKFLEVFNKYIDKLEEENRTLKANIEFLHSCLDDRENSIEIMKEENKELKEEIEKLEYMRKTDKEHIKKLQS